MDAQLASSKSTPLQHKRFTTDQHGYELSDISLSLSGNIAVSGKHHLSRRTFIDLYFGRNSGCKDKLKFYSKEFEKRKHHWPNRYVSFLEKNGSELLVTCTGQVIAIIDMKNKYKELQSCTVTGEILSVAVREGEIFIGFAGSNTVIVFNNDLKEMKRIMLKDSYTPLDLQVIKDTLFVLTGRDRRALSIAEGDGSVKTQYEDITGTQSVACSIAASERLSLVAVLWEAGDFTKIIVYSLNENKTLLIFNVNSQVLRIRISEKDRMMITGTRKTGEIQRYHLEQLFSLESMKRTLASIVLPSECEELRNHFGIPEKELSKRGAGDKSKKVNEKEKTMKNMQCLLTIIEEKGHLNLYNIKNLTDAVSSLTDMMRVSYLKGPMEGHVLHGIRNRHELERAESKLETAESKVKELQEENETLHREMDQVRQKYKDQQHALGKKTKRTEEKLNDKATVTTKKMKISSGKLESCDISRTSSATQSMIAKEPKALKEVLSQQKESNAELQENAIQSTKIQHLQHVRQPNSPYSVIQNAIQSTEIQHRQHMRQPKSLDSFIQLVYRELGSEWIDVGINLGLCAAQLNHIETECSECLMRNHKMLTSWKQSEGASATCEVLSDALKKARRKDLVDRFFSSNR